MPENRNTREKRRPVNSRTADDDALETLGIRAWASNMGVAAESALAAVTAVLTGVSGPDACLEATWGPMPLPKLDLLTAKSHLPVQRLIDCLVAPVRQMNRRLAQKMGVHSPEALEFCTAGPFGAGSKHMTADLMEKTVRRHWQVLTQASDDRSLLGQDLAFDPVPNRMEAITHPDFLIENARGRDLTALVDHCHQHTAFVVRPVLALERRGSEPYQLTSQLAALLDGTIAQKRTGHPTCQTALAHVILSLGDAEVEFVQTEGPELLGRLLWVIAGAPTNTQDPAASRRFFDAYRRAITHILDLRRQGRNPMICLQSEDSIQQFDTELGKYRAGLDQMPVDPGSSARALPETLLWAMGFLRLASPDKPSDESLVRAAFTCARQLVGVHVTEMTRQDDARQLDAHCLFARQIVDQVVAKAPLKFRDLVRSFGKQRKERFIPVVEVLVEMGVLVRDEQGQFNLGMVALADVMDELVERLATGKAGESTPAAVDEGVESDCPGDAQSGEVGEVAEELKGDEEKSEDEGTDPADGLECCEQPLTALTD